MQVLVRLARYFLPIGSHEFPAPAGGTLPDPLLRTTVFPPVDQHLHVVGPHPVRGHDALVVLVGQLLDGRRIQLRVGRRHGLPQVVPETGSNQHRRRSASPGDII